MTLPDFVRQISLETPLGGRRGLEDLPSESDLGMALGPLDRAPGPLTPQRGLGLPGPLPLGLGLNPSLAPAASAAPELPSACRLVAAI